MAIHDDINSKTAFIDWAVASPENNPQIMPVKKYYIKEYGAEYLGYLHPYQIFIDEEHGRRIREVYTYEWAD